MSTYLIIYIKEKGSKKGKNESNARPISLGMRIQRRINCLLKVITHIVFYYVASLLNRYVLFLILS